MPVSEAQKKAKAKYDLKTTQYVFRFRNEADSDIIERLRNINGKTEYIRQLIRRDIEND